MKKQAFLDKVRKEINEKEKLQNMNKKKTPSSQAGVGNINEYLKEESPDDEDISISRKKAT